MNDKNASFMDGRTLLAILLVGGVWFGWQQYLAKKYGEAPPTVASTVTGAQTAPGVSTNGNTALTSGGVKETVSSKAEEFITIDDENWTLIISSKGMGLKSALLKKYTDRSDSKISIGPDHGPFPLETRLIGSGEALDFDIKQVSATEIEGTAKTGSGTIKKIYRIEPANYALKTFIIVDGMPAGYPGVSTYFSEVALKDLALAPAGKKVANDVAAWQEYYIAHGTTSERARTTHDKPHAGKFTNVAMASLSSRYFSQSIVDHSAIAPTFETLEKDELYLGILSHESVPGSNSQKIEYTAFVGPKALDILRRADPRLGNLVDFGWFSFIAEPILSLMHILYGFVHNWGVAIVLLTLLVRLLVLPFNVMSYKSMKVMQAIQPQMTAIREKYKSDPQTQQVEIMRLMKENKANPVGGCLPMLLQIPVFFALYRSLDQSIELYKAPFMFWLHDLSMKDPYYVLPVLMGASMFVQQKITPSTMDPAQAKVMQFMPILFTFLMVNLPSGLNLYIFVSTLFGVVQQLAFLRDKKKQTSSVRVQA